jgi:hypothetical protein
VVWADLHNGELVIQAGVSSSILSTNLVLLYLSVATSWDVTGSKSKVLRVLEIALAETTILVTKSLSLSIWIPLIMGLIMSVVLVEGVVQVTVDPRNLGIHSQEEWHLRVLVGLVIESLSDGVEESLVEIRVNYFISKIVVPLLLVVLREVGRIEVNR